MFRCSIRKLSWLEGMCKSCFLFKCDKEKYAADYQQQESSEKKESEEVAGRSDDAEPVIHCASRRFCKYFLEYNGELDATVRSTKFRRSPLPQGGLEIPIKLRVGKGKASCDIFRKLKGFTF